MNDLPAIDLGDPQDWAKIDPAVAFHLIFRHAENWAHTGVLMERWARQWVKANPETAATEQAGSSDTMPTSHA